MTWEGAAHAKDQGSGVCLACHETWPCPSYTLERIMRRALRDGDVKGVHAALTLMATKDPHRAELLLDALRLGLSLATTESVAEEVGADVQPT